MESASSFNSEVIEMFQSFLHAVYINIDLYCGSLLWLHIGGAGRGRVPGTPPTPQLPRELHPPLSLETSPLCCALLS